MGKHKDKSKKHKKDKKKKSKKQKKEYSSSSEEEWVEKKINSSSSSEEDSNNKRLYSRKRNYSSEDNEQSALSSEDESIIRNTRKSPDCSRDKIEDLNQTNDRSREDWMNLPTSFLTSSNSDRKRKRDEERRLEREKQQYDPRNCSRELNPYWKDGGDGLPKFKKPDLDNERVSHYSKKEYGRSSNWRKKKDSEKNSLIDSTKQIFVKEPEKSSSNLETVESDDKVLSEKELNMLAAKLVKAEIMGNTKLINELKEKLDKARSQKSTTSSQIQEKEILLTRTDSQGRSQPLKQQSDYGEPSGNHKRKKNVETHKDGQRVRYFADDDKYSLKQMFEAEKYNSVENQNSEFVKMAGRIRKNDDLDDIFADNIRKKESDSKIDSKNRDKAVSEHQKMSTSLDSCNKCIQSEVMLKHLMVSIRETSYLALPSYEPLTEGHCLIVPIRHIPCATQLDENEWSEILDMRKDLVKLFKSRNEEAIFFETAISLHKFPHMFIECIPMPKEEGDMAPIYFKKAIDESETEWVLNKKLVSLKGRDVRKAIPKGLPYFSVSFGMEEGFAHVIEDEQMFPRNFAQEIIGGMLDIHHSKWRKPKRQSFDEQSNRVLAFSKDWKEFEST